MPFVVPTTSYNLPVYLDKALTKIDFLNKKSEKSILLQIDSSGVSKDGVSSWKNEVVTKKPALEIIAQVTDMSTGCNPRSVKRMLNTLSLINNIQATKQSQAQENNISEEDRIAEKVILFCLVSLQIAYPEIYNLLCDKPAFMDWDLKSAQMKGYGKLSKEEEKDLNEQQVFDEDFEKVIYLCCRKLPHLKNEAINISRIFSIMRALILFHNHKKLFGTSDISGIELLDHMTPQEIYSIYTPDEDDEESEIEQEKKAEASEESTGESQKNSEEDVKNIFEELDRKENMISEIIGRAMEKLIGIAGTAGYGSSRKVGEKKVYTKKKVYYSIESYESTLPEACKKAMSLFKALKVELDRTFGDNFITYEYKANNQILIRPKNPKRKRGIASVLMRFTLLKITSNNLKVNSFIYKDDVYLSDSIDQVVKDMPRLIACFNELSEDFIPVPEHV